MTQPQFRWSNLAEKALSRALGRAELLLRELPGLATGNLPQGDEPGLIRPRSEVRGICQHDGRRLSLRRHNTPLKRERSYYKAAAAPCQANFSMFSNIFRVFAHFARTAPHERTKTRNNEEIPQEFQPQLFTIHCSINQLSSRFDQISAAPKSKNSVLSTRPPLRTKINNEEIPLEFQPQLFTIHYSSFIIHSTALPSPALYKQRPNPKYYSIGGSHALYPL